MIGLVSCSATKLDRPAPARELYTSNMFRMSLRLAERHCAKTFILSAMHGLVVLDEVVEPYDLKLTALGADARAQWAGDVLDRLFELAPEAWLAPIAERDLLVLAGESYVEPIWGSLLCRGWIGTVLTPLRGLGVGARLQRLSRELEASS